jgi:hypothetical protein
VILEGIRRATGGGRAEVVHGSTVATNALLERTGARTAFVTTEGFADLVFIGRQNPNQLIGTAVREIAEFEGTGLPVDEYRFRKAIQAFRIRPVAEEPSGELGGRGRAVYAIDDMQALHADFIRAVGKEAGDSRIWAGIHYQIDNESGVQLGRSVAQKFITWANGDGSQ